MPLGEVAFKIGATLPEHKVKGDAKSGIIFALVTVTDIIKLLAHCPEFGVKV